MAAAGPHEGGATAKVGSARWRPTIGAMLYWGFSGVASMSSRRATTSGPSRPRPTSRSTAAMHLTCARRPAQARSYRDPSPPSLNNTPNQVGVKQACY